jgi:hypothetical protein
MKDEHRRREMKLANIDTEISVQLSEVDDLTLEPCVLNFHGNISFVHLDQATHHESKCRKCKPNSTVQTGR